MKGVVLDGERVVLLENDRGEWELPGGKLEPGKTPEACVEREIAEELGIAVAIGPILDSWVYHIAAGVDVLIVTYGCERRAAEPLRRSAEHRTLGRFTAAEIAGLPMPDGYRASIRRWLALRG